MPWFRFDVWVCVIVCHICIWLSLIGPEVMGIYRFHLTWANLLKLGSGNLLAMMATTSIHYILWAAIGCQWVSDWLRDFKHLLNLSWNRLLLSFDAILDWNIFPELRLVANLFLIDSDRHPTWKRWCIAMIASHEYALYSLSCNRLRFPFGLIRIHGNLLNSSWEAVIY